MVGAVLHCGGAIEPIQHLGRRFDDNGGMQVSICRLRNKQANNCVGERYCVVQGGFAVPEAVVQAHQELFTFKWQYLAVQAFHSDYRA